MNDKEIQLYNAIESLNLEIINLKNSKEYLLGNSINKSFKLLKHLKIKKIIDRYKYKKKAKYVEKNLCSHSMIKNQDKIFSQTEMNYLKSKKVAIFTCIVGNYDTVKEPLIMDGRFDYFLFTDNDKITSENWNIKSIPKKIMDLGNNTLINRYIKFHPHEFFSNYDYAVYIDGNVKIISNLDPLICKANSKLGIAMHKHASRDCIYLESEACTILKKGNINKMKTQIDRYKKVGMPKKFGLFEATIIITDIKNSKSKNILDEWWDELYNSQSLRDQIALPYIIWKNKYESSGIGILGDNLYRNPKFRVDSH